ncbi:polysaccharide biosynthesis tyrosine autokinase [Kitasatospora arboriphila]|uniref:non-specific protein-tyrosine kinase n=1 Tax=Kitasatospora arboriphila TaxID=258052 RepID=A0ABN1TZF5_9ACTN
MDLRGCLRTLSRHWWLVTLLALLGTGAGVAAAVLSTPVYEARTQLFVATRSGEDATALNQGNNFSQARVRSYASIVTSRRVTEPVVAKLRLGVTPEQLASQITAAAPVNTVLIDITLQDTVPARAAQTANAVADQLRAVVQELETPADSTTSPVQLGVTQRAQPPAFPVSPNRRLDVAAGLLVGLLLGIGAAALRQALDTTVSTAEQLGELAGVPVLGEVPYDRSAPADPLDRAAGGWSARSEAIRQLRTNLQFAQVDDRPRVVGVTSALPGEGKTTTAANLARSLVEAGDRVCLVDADLRRPQVAEVFGLVRDAGLTSVLIGSAAIEDVMQNAAGLDVLTSGTIPPNPAELLASARMHHVLQSLAERYDHVVVDTAPLLPVADTSGLAPFTDGMLLVVRARRTSRDRIRAATDALRAVGARPLGAVLDMVPAAKGARSGYGYGYGYGEPVPRPAGSDERGATDQAPLAGRSAR